ncbi:MAG TPA: hypothetical protein VEV62_03455, partial [Parafilimonas sp.]|nr:hypothetical protein [Parafilimonas sp.]
MNKIFLYIAYALTIFIIGCGSKQQQSTQIKTTQDTLQAFVVTQQQVSKTVTLPSQLVSFE